VTFLSGGPRCDRIKSIYDKLGRLNFAASDREPASARPVCLPQCCDFIHGIDLDLPARDPARDRPPPDGGAGDRLGYDYDDRRDEGVSAPALL
jgi:hypothetical protein